MIESPRRPDEGPCVTMDDQQLLRYSRHILLPEVDIEGQHRLCAQSALIVGLGGLGSPASMYLAAAGVGRLVLCDDDRVDLSNLQRQILHTTDQIGRLKTESAAHQLTALNPDVRLEFHPLRPDPLTLEQLIASVDVVLDCSDNLSTRRLVNEMAFRVGRPLVSGAAIRFEGQIGVFDPSNPESPCYNCLYPDADRPLERCAESGVLAPVPGIIGSFQALEALKLMINPALAMTGHLLVFDGLRAEWLRLEVPKDPGCPICH